jgi:hypothetical protein
MRCPGAGLAMGVALSVVILPTAGPGPPGETVRGGGVAIPGTACPSFPADAVWNTPVTGLPVNAKSAEWLAAMKASSAYLHPDYGPSGDPSSPYGMPWTVVTPKTPLTRVSFIYASESDKGPYPFSAATPIEGGIGSTGDRHAIMVNSSTCELYELWDAHYTAARPSAGSGATWDLKSDALRPAGWTSADAAGLPILPLLVNYDEVSSGALDHAVRVTAQCTQRSYIWPARHEAGEPNAGCPPMGARFRMRPGFSLPGNQCSAFCQTVLRSMKTYGLIVADNGSNWYFQGTADTRWTYEQVDQLKRIPASAFQAVDESCLQLRPGSAQAYQPGTRAYAGRCG